MWYTNSLIERRIRWKTQRKRRNFTPEFNAEVVLEELNVETSQAELCRRYNITEKQLAQWKRQFLENAASLFESTDKPSEVFATERIAQLEQLVGQLTQAVDIQKYESYEISHTVIFPWILKSA